jgi:hypothetical protein
MSENYPIDVHILDEQTGEVVVYKSEGYDDDDEPPGTFNPFIWCDGNFSCDCNRALFFAEAAGRPRPEDSPCTETRYRIVQIVRVSDAKVVYQEPG